MSVMNSSISGKARLIVEFLNWRTITSGLLGLLLHSLYWGYSEQSSLWGEENDVVKDPTRLEGLTEYREEVRRMHDEELSDFIRDTVVHLNVLADRLESLVSPSEGDSG